MRTRFYLPFFLAVVLTALGSAVFGQTAVGNGAFTGGACGNGCKTGGSNVGNVGYATGACGNGTCSAATAAPTSTPSVAPSVAPSVTTLQAATVALAPYQYLRLNETSGTTATDSSGNSRNGTYTGSFGFSSTAVTNNDSFAVGFAGASNTYVDTGIGGSDALVTGSAFTACVWYRASSLPGGYMSFFGNDDVYTNGRGVAAWLDSAGKYGFRIATSGSGGWKDVYGATAVTTGTNHQFCAVYNGTDTRGYTDGALDLATSATAVTGTINAAGFNLFVGNRPADLTNGFTGVLGEVAFWGSALTATQITTLYNTGHL